MDKKPKLRTYKTFKASLVLESYLLSEKDRRGGYLFTAIRTGTNKLRIESGRWKRPVEPVEERKCMVCRGGVIEDEKHFMLSCRGYDQFRASLFLQILYVSEGKWRLQALTPESQWRVIMGGSKDKFESDIFDQVKKFVRLAIRRRYQLLDCS
jgi:hypothetical protein